MFFVYIYINMDALCAHVCLYMDLCVQAQQVGLELTGSGPLSISHPGRTWWWMFFSQECRKSPHRSQGPQPGPSCQLPKSKKGSYCFVILHLKIAMWYDKTHKLHAEEEATLCAQISSQECSAVQSQPCRAACSIASSTPSTRKQQFNPCLLGSCLCEQVFKYRI